MHPCSTEMLRCHPATRGLDSRLKPLSQCEVVFQVGGHDVGPKTSPPKGSMVLLQVMEGICLWLAGAGTSRGHLQARPRHWLLRFGWANLRVSAHEQKVHFKNKAAYEVLQNKYFGHLWPFITLRQEFQISFSILKTMSPEGLSIQM